MVEEEVVEEEVEEEESERLAPRNPVQPRLRPAAPVNERPMPRDRL